jgi:hypothetical protein
MSTERQEQSHSRRWQFVQWGRPRMLTTLAILAALAVTASARAAHSEEIDESSRATWQQDSAAPLGRKNSAEPTPDFQVDDTAHVQAVADSPSAELIPIVALCLGFLGCAVGGLSYVLLRGLVREVDRQERVIASTQTALNRLQALLPSRAETMIPRPGQDVPELRDRLHHVEYLVAMLQEHVRVGLASATEGRVQRPDVPLGRDVEPTDTRAPAPPGAPDAVFDVLPGTLSDDSVVKLSTSSKPMVAIHWQDGGSTAEVWVNPEYKFADLNARYLESAFDVDIAGPGSFETVAPAILNWTHAASSGHVVKRGRVRAVAST